MMKYLLGLALYLITNSFIAYFVIVMNGRKKKITESNGFNITKDILNEYNSINIVEGTGKITFYQLRRKVIRIASRCYYGNTLSDIAIPLMEAGISVNDSKTIDTLSKLFTNLKKLYIFPILLIILGFTMHGTTDIKICAFLSLVFVVLQHLLISIKSSALVWLKNKIGNIKELSKENGTMVIEFIKKTILFDQLIFLGEFIMLIRFILILIKI